MYQIVLKFDTRIDICEEQDDNVYADIVFNFIPIKEIRLRACNTVCGKNMLLINEN
jgi:hypothetical protein